MKKRESESSNRALTAAIAAMFLMQSSTIMGGEALAATGNERPTIQNVIINYAQFSNTMLNTESAQVKIKAAGGHFRIPVRVYDFARVDRDVLESAEKLAGEIFRKAGSEVVWLDGAEAQPNNGEARGPEFRVNIVPTFEMLSGAQGKRNDDTLGFAIPCDESDEACLLYVLYSRISAWAGRDGIGPSRILGHVMAHEIGHALLGPNAHTPIGVMQARIPKLDMGRVLYFTDVQSQQLRADLIARIAAVKSRLREQEADSGFVPSRFRTQSTSSLNADGNPRSLK